jgi:hypothetical protein
MDSKHRMGFVVGIVCALAACSSRTAYAEAPTDPCALLTPAQVSAVVGVTVGAGQPIGTTGCQWSTATQGNPTNAPVRATLALWDAAAFADMKTPLPGFTKTPASGIGEDAVYATARTLTTLGVKKGNVAFVIRLYGVPGQDKQMATEKALALDVLAAL